MSVLLLSALLGSALATEATSAPLAAPTDEKSRAIYAHPAMTVISALGASSGAIPLILPVTYEREMGDGKSWTVQPTLVFGSLKQTAINNEEAPKLSVFELRLLGTQRNYFNGNVSEGWYWAPAVSLGYARISQPFKQGRYGYWSAVDINGYGAGALAYVGWRGKWSELTMYVDGGLGGQYISLSGTGNQSYAKSGVAFDLNIGMGKAF